jgi:hypothetical protein
MSTLTLAGNILASGDGVAVPSGTDTYPIATTPDPKSYAVSASGVKLLASPSSFLTLSDIGTGGNVTNASFLYLKSSAAITVRITPAGLSAATFKVQGTLILEFAADALCQLVEVKGTATVEYLATGTT